MNFGRKIMVKDVKGEVRTAPKDPKVTKNGMYFVKYDPGNGVDIPESLLVCMEMEPGNLNSMRVVSHFSGPKAAQLCHFLDPDGVNLGESKS